jgi:transposase-like protein
MENRTVKKVIRNHRYFSEDFKIQKVKEIEQNLISVSELCRLYEVSGVAVYKWIHKYSLHLKKGITQVIEMESESKKTQLLQKRVAEMERIIGQKQLTIDFLEKVIEFSSEEIGTDLKKKYDTESLDGSKKTKGGTK